MVWLTGDIHGSHSINKLSTSNFPISTMMCKDDIVIILGDFGLLWKSQPDKEEKYWTKWLTDKPWTTIVVPGNHENWDRIHSLEKVDKFGGKMGKYNDSIFFMERGEIYDIDGNIIFNMGGAHSIDRDDRILGISWWNEELPTVMDFEHGFRKLEEFGNEVDYILGHTCSNYAIDKMFKPRWKINDIVSNYFDVVVDKVSFKKFYFGHWHKDIDDGEYRALYHNIIKLGD